MIRQEIIKLTQKATGAFPKEIRIEHPERKGFGDYSTSIALKLKKPAPEIVKKLKSNLFERVEVAGPGFINFFLAKEYLQKQVGEILKQKEDFGQLDIGKNSKVQVEFISANPTGPLTVGNARGGQSGYSIGGTRPGGDQNHPHLAGSPGIGVGHMGSALFMPRQDKPDRALV